MNILPIAKYDITQWLMGSDPKREGSLEFEWAYLPESWGVFVWIAIIGAIAFSVFWLYRSEIQTCPMPIKLLMAGLRLTTLLFLIGLFLRPSVFYQQITEIKPVISILRDESLSFARGDKYRDGSYVKKLARTTGAASDEIASGEVSRADMLNKILADETLIREMRDKGSLHIVDFADGTKQIAIIPALTKNDVVNSKNNAVVRDDTKSGQIEKPPGNQTPGSVARDNLIRNDVPELTPRGLGTDIWQALRESLDSSRRLSAIVLISDGQHNGSEDPIEIANRAGDANIPIFVIGVGDPNPPKNLAVTEVFVRNKAYPDEPFEIEAILQANSRGQNADMPRQITVELVQQRIDENTGTASAEKVVKSVTVDVPEKGGRIRVDFGHTISEPGRYQFIVRTDPLENETNKDDNALVSSQMQVVDEQVKVLLISGVASWDYQHVQRLLTRDQTISVSCWLQSMDDSRPQEGNEPISRLPRSIEELGQYNVVIMMDPDPKKEFDQEWIETLKTFCKVKAGGVFFMAGPQFSSEFVTMNRLNGIRDILPVRFGDTEFIDTTEALATATENRPGRMLLVNHNMDHPVLSFNSDPAKTQQRWAQMPGIEWSFPTLAAKPTARILMEHGDKVNVEGNEPLLVSGRYGAGTVLYMGFHGTWRWRAVGLQSQFFDKFWIQVTRFLVENRSLQGMRRGFIDSDQTEYELGGRIQLIASVLDSQFKPSTEPIITAIVHDEKGRTQNVELRLRPKQLGRYEGTMIAQRTGNFTATIDLGESAPEEKLIDPITFRIVPPSVESGVYWLNENLLKKIAEQSGGKYFELYEMGELPVHLPQKVEIAKSKSPSKPIWDAGSFLRNLFFLIPVVLLTIEWALRKWHKLL